MTDSKEKNLINQLVELQSQLNAVTTQVAEDYIKLLDSPVSTHAEAGGLPPYHTLSAAYASEIILADAALALITTYEETGSVSEDSLSAFHSLRRANTHNSGIRFLTVATNRKARDAAKRITPLGDQESE